MFRVKHPKERLDLGGFRNRFALVMILYDLQSLTALALGLDVFSNSCETAHCKTHGEATGGHTLLPSWLANIMSASILEFGFMQHANDTVMALIVDIENFQNATNHTMMGARAWLNDVEKNHTWVEHAMDNVVNPVLSSTMGYFQHWSQHEHELVFIIIGLWAVLAGYLGLSLSVIRSREMREQFPFVREDVFQSLPGLSTATSTFCNAMFAVILSKLLRFLSDMAKDDAGTEELQVGLTAALMLFYYVPSASTFGVCFLEPRNHDEHIRTIGAFTLHDRLLKFLIGVSKTVLPETVQLAVTAIVLACLAAMTHFWKPARDLPEINRLRSVGYIAALHAVLVKVLLPFLPEGTAKPFVLGGWLLIALGSIIIPRLRCCCLPGTSRVNPQLENHTPHQADQVPLLGAVAALAAWERVV